ncbi:flap endonuclease GEN homolog 1 isoform X2 [Rhinatrema bivittatum]|uniref:flap endonuclease GEN homolog 1 isoform X2 n=1 Tax=Rhinatrema bivittatum TaxID=194408 RepID=UPI001127D0D9|nr:flap endonuclease GEN homolog 1 isoform X2 [Rhinatrema bivittatum]
MGVTDLWQILDPVKQHIQLKSLSGKTLAVDLSLWVCEAQTVKKMIGIVTKPHLRNLFFRVSFLTLMGVRLVFVMEGDAPKLKADTMSKRSELRYGASKKMGSTRTGRSHFVSVLKECLEMLEYLGVPWVQAAGEAEAMCAYLNANGYVDGCITNDGDVFLYGAQTVYRNFTMNVKDPHVDCYKISSIKERLGFNRDALVGLGVLLGCDYLPKGVPGVGKEQALKLIETLKGQSLLERFCKWEKQFKDGETQAVVIKKMTHCSICCHPGSAKDHERNGCKLCGSAHFCEPHDYNYQCPCEWHHMEREKQVNAVENSIKKKARACEGFPFHEVIQEFVITRDKLVKLIKWQRPSLLSFQKFALETLEWPQHYSCEKVLVLLTHHDMCERKSGRIDARQLQALRAFHRPGPASEIALSHTEGNQNTC